MFFSCLILQVTLFWPTWPSGTVLVNFACGRFLASTHFRPSVCGQVHWQVRGGDPTLFSADQLTVQASSAASTKEGQVASYWIKPRNIQLAKKRPNKDAKGCGYYIRHVEMFAMRCCPKSIVAFLHQYKYCQRACMFSCENLQRALLSTYNELTYFFPSASSAFLLIVSCFGCSWFCIDE